MFGRDNNDDTAEDNSIQVSVVPSASDDTTTPTADPATPQEEINLPAPAVDEPADEEMESISPEPAEPAVPEVVEEAPTAETPVEAPVPDAELSSAAPVSTTSSQDLGSLRQEALHELSPLIGHLDQTPEEKYETAKMVYEETNDQALLPTVYEAAKNLTDEKAKAQAIYDVIQKINEFTAKG
jgi:hypothetical protein